jgi:hypothetical protein
VNIERPTSNGEIASLRHSKKRIPYHFFPSKKQDAKNIKNDSIPYSKFEVGRSMFTGILFRLKGEKLSLSAHSASRAQRAVRY